MESGQWGYRSSIGVAGSVKASSGGINRDAAATENFVFKRLGACQLVVENGLRLFLIRYHLLWQLILQ